jgi:hypothetical protein
MQSRPIFGKEAETRQGAICHSNHFNALQADCKKIESHPMTDLYLDFVERAVTGQLFEERSEERRFADLLQRIRPGAEIAGTGAELALDACTTRLARERGRASERSPIRLGASEYLTTWGRTHRACDRTRAS